MPCVLLGLMGVNQRFENCNLASNLVAIRPLSRSDLRAIFTAGNDDQMQKWFPLPFPYTNSDAESFLEFANQRQMDGSGLISAIEHEGKFAGVVDIKKADWRAKCCEIGYWSSPWVRSRGVTSVAVLMVSQWIFREVRFQRIEVRVAPENRASKRVAEKAGYVREGIARNAGFTNNGRLDLIIYSRIPSDL